MSVPSIAVVGCGAVSEMFHLPALSRRPELMKQAILVDPDLARARDLAGRLGALDAASDYRQVMSRVQGALVATPHRLHHPITLDFVRHGVPVLCEKPLAENAAEVDEIVAASREHGVPVAVNQTRRLFASFREIHRMIEAGELGEILEIDYELGEPFQWPAATAGYFGVKSGGRGVLFDTGAHIVDLVCWWLGGEPEVVDYRDDSHGGTEAVAHIDLRRGKARAHVHLSWLTKLRNVYRVTGTKGSVTGGVYEWSTFTHETGGRSKKISVDKSSRQLPDFMDMLLDNFAKVITEGAAPIVSAADVRPVIAAMDECYRRRAPMPQPWHDVCERLAAHV